MTDSKRGGRRPRSGRPPLGRKRPVFVRVSEDVFKCLSSVSNRSALINHLLEDYFGLGV